MRSLFILPLIVCIFSVKAQVTEQSLDSMVSLCIKKLNERGVQKVGWRKIRCIGYMSPFQDWPGKCDKRFIDCHISLFWIENEKTLFKFFDNCSSYKPMAIKDTLFFTYYQKYAASLKVEQVKPFQLYRIVGKDTSILDRGVSHVCISTFLILNAKDSLSKEFNHFDLNQGKIDEPNINWYSNNHLKLVIWDKQIAGFMKDLEKKKKFRRTKGKHKFS